MNKNIFEEVAGPKVPRSVHDLGHELNLSCNMGELIPVTWVDCLPGTKIRVDNEALVRMMPMVAPVFTRFNVTFHRYFVPKRLLWDHWDEYVSLTKVGGTLPVHPNVDLDPTEMDPSNPGVYPFIRLRNYMGIPYQYDPVVQITSALINPMRWAAYQFICNEYYRDQNLIAEFPYKLTDGSNNAQWEDLSRLRRRAWRHDYFTSGLPFTQKGDAVLLPISGPPNVVKMNTIPDFPNEELVESVQWDTVPVTLPKYPRVFIEEQTGISADHLYTEVEGSTTTTINDFRFAVAIQKFKERLARTGSGRFTEFLKGIFGIRSRDSRLQRPEYVGGVIKPITISEVLQTSQSTTADPSPQGNMSGHGATYITGNDSNYFAEEHGYLITIMNIQPNGMYFQGLDKELLKVNHPTEIYVPDTANLGEQSTQRQELYAYTTNAAEVFNYVPRWTEHRFISNRVMGQLAQNALMHWHAGRKFDSEPNFNQEFIEMEPTGSTDRIFAVTDANEEKLLVDVYNTVKVVAPIPKNGTPSL